MRRRSLIRTWALRALAPLPLLSVATLAGETPAADPEAAALVERIEAYHQSLPHFEVRFEQRFAPRIFGRERVETGRLTVKRPARMRWEYEDPEAKVFVSDGASTWFHVPADRQVIVGSFAGAGDAGSGEAGSGEAGSGMDTGPNPLFFLTGEATILDHFDALLRAEPPGPGLRELSLVPRRPSAEISSLSLVVHAADGQIRGIESEDLEGNRTVFAFRDFRFGAAPADALFTFVIPPGTDVVMASDLGR